MTKWDQARHFLETFVRQIVPAGEGWIVKEGREVYSADFSIDYETKPGNESGFMIGVEDGVIAWLLASGEGTSTSNELQDLLEKNGLPDEVWLHTNPYGPTVYPTGDVGIDLIVYYRQKGFWVHFRLDGKKVGHKLRACSQSFSPILYLWPTRAWTFEDLIQQTLGSYYPGAPKYSILEVREATSMSVQEFYDTFKNPENQNCLETPVDIWP